MSAALTGVLKPEFEQINLRSTAEVANFLYQRLKLPMPALQVSWYTCQHVRVS